MRRSHRIQEWLADRLSWVQYPDVRAADDTTRAASRTGVRFTTPMPIMKRVDLVLLSGLLIAAGLIAFFFLGFLLYALLF